MNSNTAIYVGIDVSKATLDVATYPTGEYMSVENSESGIASLLKYLQGRKPALVVMEATGGYQMLAASTLADAGIPVSVMNPKHVRDFAKAIGKLAKTDKIDAHVIAHFAEATKPEPRPLANKEQQALTAIMARRRQVVEMLVSEKNRLKQAHSSIAPAIQEHIQWLEANLKVIDKDMEQFIKASPIWREKDELLQSVPGVGPVVSKTIIANLPEIGTVSNKQIAALTGVAPFNCDSGTMRGKRIVWGGRAHVRSCLYMATLTAIRFNPAIKAFYNRLLEAGKQRKLAITACMRKLLTMLNAIVKSCTPWKETLSPCV